MRKDSSFYERKPFFLQGVKFKAESQKKLISQIIASFRQIMRTFAEIY